MIRKVLITGITGMAGSHLADLLVTMPDIRVYGVKRRRSPLENLKHILSRIDLIDCDLTDQMATLKAVEAIAPDVVFHLAALTYVPDSWQQAQVTISNNILMQLNLFESIRHARLDPVIQVALSSEQYGFVQQDELPLNEQSAFRPLSPYAVSKVGQDMLAYQYFKTWGLKTVRTRSFNHEGPRRGDDFVTSNFARQIVEIKLGLKKAEIHVGNLKARRDWTDVRDVVRAYWLAVEKCPPGDDFNICSGASRTVGELLETLLEIARVKAEVIYDPARERPSDVMLLEGDYTKFHQLTGWRPTIPFEQTLSDMLSFWEKRIESSR